MNYKVQQSLIEQIKNEWKKDISRNIDIGELKVISNYYMNAIESINCIKTYDDNQISNQNNLSNTSRVEDKEQSNEQDHDVYVLRRRLIGGDGIKSLNDNNPIFVPEKIIRQQSLEHGDNLLYIKNGLEEGKHKYEKIEEPIYHISLENSEIESYDFAIVEYDKLLDKFVCKESHDSGELKRIPYFSINDYDVQKFSIKDGDIVSIAREQDTNYRIRWKHSVSEPLPTPNSKKSSYYKSKKEDKEQLSQWLKDKVIGIVGADTYINSYIEEIEKRGGKVRHTESDKPQQIESIVFQSDVLIIPIRQTSHAKAEQSKAYAKQIDRPFIILDTSGRSHLISKLKEHFNIDNEI
ncbi:TPA: DUF2325 domain-containing protein [Clostridioides difficile]|nr:DUF2325 domain-containing protein [Clostridioides difficile]